MKHTCSYMSSDEKQSNFKRRSSLTQSSKLVPNVLHLSNIDSGLRLTLSREPVIPGTAWIDDITYYDNSIVM